jgi:hypothetical protein
MPPNGRPYCDSWNSSKYIMKGLNVSKLFTIKKTTGVCIFGKRRPLSSEGGAYRSLLLEGKNMKREKRQKSEL